MRIPKSPNHFIFLLVLMLTAFQCCREAKVDAPSIAKAKKEISEVSAERARAFNNSNAAGIARHFTENAILMAPGKSAQVGRKAVEQYYQFIFDAYKPQLESHYEEIGISGDMAYGRGVAKVTLIPKKGGSTLHSTAKYLNILKRQPDGSWKTTHDIWNSNQPAE